MKWINIRDEKPKQGQEVFYFFEYVGVHQGIYEEIYNEGLDWIFDCFSGKGGSLCDDVTDWMPYTEGDILPEPPIDFIQDKYEDYEQ